MKGIILAGGSGTRLSPLTRVCSKQLLPVYDKPMIYYPLSLLILSGVREVLIITSPYDNLTFRRLLGTGENLGVSISYEVQERASGLPEAFVIGEKFIGNDSVMLILGDNIFYGDQSILSCIESACRKDRPTIFAYRVSDPARYGVVELCGARKILSIEEKPNKPKSNYAITGLYVFDKRVVKMAKDLKPSSRGETEMVDIISQYHRLGELDVQVFGRGLAWFDTGTVDSLVDASNFVQAIEKRQGFKIACLEEVAYRKKLISLDQLKRLSQHQSGNYQDYLESIVKMEELL